MKNIYDLLNQAEDNEDILSENERMEMTDIENAEFITEYCWIQKREQEEQSCDELEKKYQDNEKAQQVRRWTEYREANHKIDRKQAKKGRKAKKLLTAAACMAVIYAVGFTAGAAVKNICIKYTVRLQREAGQYGL